MGTMYMRNEYSDFDFDSVWYIKEGFSTPMLRGMPNMPVPTSVTLRFEGNESLENRIRDKIFDDTFVMDSAATKLVKLNVATIVRLDSLEGRRKRLSSGT